MGHYLEASQEQPAISWCPKAHYQVYRNPPLFFILSQMKSVQILPSYFIKFNYNLPAYTNKGARV